MILAQAMGSFYYIEVKQKPWPIILLAIFHILAPFGNIVFNSLRRQIPLTEYLTSVMTLQYIQLNWPLFVLPITGGIAIYITKKWSFYIYILSMFGLLSFNILAFSNDGVIFSPIPFFGVIALNILIVGYFLIPEVKEVYFNESVRWWERQERFNCLFQCYWQSQGEDKPHLGEVTNISNSGLFVKSKDLVDNDMPIELNLHTDGTEVTIHGIVKRHAQATTGFGVHFIHSKDSQKKIAQITKALGAQNQSQREAPESLGQWAKGVVKEGKGIKPEIYKKD